MPKLKENSVADQIMKKFYWNLPIYCKQRNLSYKSFLRGFYSKKAKLILREDGIDLILAGVEKEENNAAN